MKVYFVDGHIDKHIIEGVPDKTIVLSALHGVTTCKKELKYYKNHDYSVITNSPLALDNKYVWNKWLEVPELYLFVDGEWTRINKLTNRKLKQKHNLFKLYIVGEFNKE